MGGELGWYRGRIFVPCTAMRMGLFARISMRSLSSLLMHSDKVKVSELESEKGGVLNE